MKRLLRKEEYILYAPEFPGVVRVNHQNDYCSGDSHSMIVERKQDGSVAAHCFRCGGGGFSPARNHHYDADSVREAHARRNEDSNLVIGGISLPDDVSGDYDSFPQAARAWLSKGGITQEIAEGQDFLWSDEKESLYLPVRQLTDLVGYVKRKGFGENEQKKYRTVKLDNLNFFGYYPAQLDKPTESVVIVEDLLSGLRVSEICDTLVALGTNLLPGAVSTIIQNGYKNAIIFLDADNPEVRANARRMAKQLPHIPVRILETGKDPKYYSREQLASLLSL